MVKKVGIKKYNKKENKISLDYANAIIGTLREPFLVLDKNLRIVSSNQSFYDNFKVKKKETVGKFLFDLGNKQWDIPALIVLLKKILPQKTIVTDYRVEHNFNQIGHRIMNLNARKLRIPSARTNLILLAIEDITEHWLAEKKLVETMAKTDAILSSVGDAVMACERNGLVTLFNPAAEAISGYLAKNVIGRHYSQSLQFIKERDKKPSNDFIAEAIESGRTTSMENHTLLIRKDGSMVPVADSAAPIRDIERALTGCVVVFRDVTHEREVDKMKTEFVSLTSHQLRAPLTGIIWLIERLVKKDGGLSDQQKDDLADIHKSAKRMAKLVEDLLNISRLESGTLKIDPKPVQFDDIIEAIIKEYESQTIQKRCSIIFDKPQKRLPPILLDESLVRQIIGNLLNNAINYSKPDECSIGIKLEKRAADYLLTVFDKGIGIPKDKQKKVFEKFFRAENAIKMKTEGNGLGLYIIKMIIELSGGKIWFESQEGEGTKFYISIPLSGMKGQEGAKTLI